MDTAGASFVCGGMAIKSCPAFRRFPRALTWFVAIAWLPLPVAGEAGAQLLAGASQSVWQALGPWGGSVPALAIEPRDPTIVWAGTRESGLFRSPDLGRTWQPRSQGLGDTWITAIALDPFNANRLWVTTIGGGFYRSRDGGGSWRRLGSGLPPPAANFVLLADPARRHRLLGLHGTTLFRSEDAGATWQLWRQNITTITFDAAGALYVGRGGDVLRSTDGAGFRRLNAAPTGMTRVRALAVHPRRSRELWAADGPSVWRSLDGGATWAERGQPALGDVRRLVPHSRLAGVLYAEAGGKLWKSRDAGATWTQLAVDASGKALVAALVVDARAPSRVVVGSWALGHPGGIFLSSNGGETFRSISAGGPAPGVSEFAVDPRDPLRILAVTYFVGALLTEDGGATWDVVSTEVVPGVAPFPTDAAFDPFVAGRLYVVDVNGLLRSDDGGASWSAVSRLTDVCSSCYWVEPDPVVPDRLYAGGLSGLARSDDAGATWTSLQSLGRPNPVHGAERILVDPADSGHLVADGAFFTGTPRLPRNEPRLIESADDGATWTRIDETLPSPPVAIAADPLDFDRLWVTTTQGLYRTDGAGGWQLVSDALSLFDLRAGAGGVLLGIGTPVAPLGQTHSLWTSRDSGVSWLDLRADLAFPPWRLERVGDRVIVTAGGGLHARNLPSGYEEP
jgi:photosystem II stability/assembly factor-like uncharacterized protein